MTETKSSTVRLRGVHRYSFRRMQWGDIIGTKMMTPTYESSQLGYDKRPVFIVQYPDGIVDYIPISLVSHYELGPAELVANE